MNVGELKKLIADIPDDAAIFPDFATGTAPSDDEPGVEILGFLVRLGAGDKQYLSVQVALFYLNKEDEDEEED